LFGLIAIIRECAVWAFLKLLLLKQSELSVKMHRCGHFGGVAAYINGSCLVYVCDTVWNKKTSYSVVLHVTFICSKHLVSCVWHCNVSSPQFLIGIAVCYVMQLAGTNYENEVSISQLWGRIKTPTFLTWGGGGRFLPIPCHIMQYSFVCTEFTKVLRLPTLS
jgi:hypothetical protein